MTTYKKLSLALALMFLLIGALFARATRSASPQAAYDFTLQGIDITQSNDLGNPIRLSDFRGQVVFLEFFASWCRACVIAKPAVEALHIANKNNDSVVVLGVNLSESPSVVAHFMRDKGITHKVGIMDNVGARRFNVTSIPTFMIIDQNGNIANVYRGFRLGMERTWQTDINALLQ
ncbi:MAG: TlpA family protein disulfide reductase [Elusimicrobia bacterium]|nr:TlpA family protein disulfide reductase [Elusimicrobiota bacterium]